MKNPGTLVFEGAWRALEVCTSKAVECCKQSSTRHCYRNSQESSSGSNVYRGDLACEASEVEQRGHFCDVLSNNLISLCPCPENLPEAKLNK